MENWGLITYRMAAILFDPKSSDAKFKERIAYTVSHELAHQVSKKLFFFSFLDKFRVYFIHAIQFIIIDVMIVVR
jgi:hypothetical protein